MKYLFVILAVICGSLLLTGCAGTRFTEMLWAVGTEEDYLIVPDNRAFICYESGKGNYLQRDYYLKCEKRTYHNSPGWFQLIGIPMSFRPNRYERIKTATEPIIVKISVDKKKDFRAEGPIYPPDFLIGGTIVDKLPSDARSLNASDIDNIIDGDIIELDGVHDQILGKKIACRKSAASYWLVPLMLPTICIDAATHLCWPLNLAVGIVLLKNEVKYREANPHTNHCQYEQNHCPR